MNLADITTKCYILALIIRDDGERLLLGDGAYEFKDSQQHFIANTYANDVVELQGTDGQMLAGQVRRTATQTFAGYIGDATFSKQKVEEARRDFLMFFRKKHYYTAVYVFSDGTAIQRDRGYIVNAPSAPELYQRFPEWSVGLSFEDPNYYEYAEDDLGHEIAAHKVELELSTAMSGGLIWDGDGAVSDDLSYVGTEIEGEGKNFQLADTGTATHKSAELLGDAEQTTYSGKNLLYWSQSGTSYLNNGITFSVNSDGTVKANGTATGNATCYFGFNTLGAGRYVLSGCPDGGSTTTYYFEANYKQTSSSSSAYPKSTSSTANGVINLEATGSVAGVYIVVKTGTTVSNVVFKPMLEQTNGTATAYEPYVGGTASPNPDFPQEVNTVTGEQVVKIEGKNLFDYASASDTANTFVSTYRLFKLEGLLPNTQYTLSGMTFSSTSDMTGKYLYIWSGDAYATREPSVFIADGGNISSSKTFTTSGTGSYYLAVYPTDATTWSSVLGFLQNAQLELGQATTYEPYQGQILPVNLGKNLLNPTELPKTQLGVTGTYQNGIFSLSGTASVASNFYLLPYSSAIAHLKAGESLTYYIERVSGTSKVRFLTYFVPDDGSSMDTTWRVDLDAGASSNTVVKTATKAGTVKYVQFFLDSGVTYDSQVKVLVQKGNISNPVWSPYFTPIELAKIGDYQDRIYKTGGKWYIEKQVGKLAININGYNSAYTNVDYAILDKPTDALNYGTYSVMPALCESAVSPETTGGYNQTAQIGRLCSQANRTHLWIGVTKGTTQATSKTMLDGKAVYYALATPTDTEITNSELVGQLERLRHAHTYADTTNFSITATSPNLPAFLKVVAFGKDATPQGGYVWEDGGAGGATTITVDGVDNAQPIWTVVGPATNPSLTNITTGESIQWTGVVPNGQTLVVNMADMTASLSGANVFEFISGSWITLQAGNNRVSYSATAATGIATLEWNGVVG